MVLEVSSQVGKLPKEAEEAKQDHALLLSPSATGPSLSSVLRPPREHTAWMACLTVLMPRPMHADTSNDDDWLEREEARTLPAGAASPRKAAALPSSPAGEDDSRSQNCQFADAAGGAKLPGI
jgi:hypothetical protein